MMSIMSRWVMLAWCVARVAVADELLDFTTLSDAERRTLVAAAPKEQLERIMKDTPQAKLLAMGLRISQGINTYRYRMLKQERVRGELLAEQVIDVYVRETPFAVRLHYVKGPGAGRKVLFNPSVRPDEFRVREAGFLSVAGAIWLNVNSSFAKADSNHTVREVGIGPLLSRSGPDRWAASRSCRKGGTTRASSAPRTCLRPRRRPSTTRRPASAPI
jgi:hypothetical protein